MTNLQIAALVYGTTALLYLTPTYVEGKGNGGHWSIQRIAGLVFCLFWPLLTAVFIYKFAAGPSKSKFVFVDPAVATRPRSAIRPSE